jgi:hypothetical protein
MIKLTNELSNQSKSQTHIATDGQLISKSLSRAPSGANDQIFIALWQLRSCFSGAPSLTRGRFCLLYMLVALASVVFLESGSSGTRDHIFLSQIWDFPFHRHLRLAGSRWRYSNPPPHGCSLKSESESESELIYDWRFTTNKFVLAPCPLRFMARFFSQLNTYGHSPYITSSLTRGWVCHLQLLLATASDFILSNLSQSQSQNYFTIGGLLPISSSWRRAPWDSRPAFSQLKTCDYSPYVTSSDERVGLSFTIAAGSRQRIHSQVRVPQDSWQHFSVSDPRLPQSGAQVPVFISPRNRVTQL